MKTKLRKLETSFKKQGYNTLLSHINGQIMLSVWNRNHKPGDDATDIHYQVSTGKVSIMNGLKLDLGDLCSA